MSFALDVGGPGPHLVRCHVTAPDGRFLAEYAANVLVAGNAGRFDVPTALSDSPGRYRLELADVAAGAKASAELMLESSPPGSGWGVELRQGGLAGRHRLYSESRIR